MDPRLLDSCARARYRASADAVLTGVTALHLLGVEVGDPLPVRLATAGAAQTRDRTVRLHRLRDLPNSAGGVALPADAWLAAASDLDLLDLVTAGDTLGRLGRSTPAELQGLASARRGRSCRHARRAAGLVRDRVDSVRETWLRLCLVLVGLPEPRTNVVLGHGERLIGRVDLLLDEFGLVIEYDGDQHRDRGQWNTDLDRDDAFAEAGFTTIRVTRDRARRPRRLVEKVHARLVQRGYAGPAPTFTPEWVELFERRV
ncbi:Very-short-patch-repair endonuclease [Microlunatus sagamiharensis]|uniref:Very-short-patch-repair endonuclease n=1 Tax=Microlunatus sagamiharensis TaxID=546874 RepID=A0A1H2MVS2_9ACTN|nr:DUF559 domain-containing protein [Microlunatus sagamiharensis]SDU97152.1 Very-short-patch-repair endonuclease [Microlunatus sagamiharensis]